MLEHIRKLSIQNKILICCDNISLIKDVLPKNVSLFDIKIHRNISILKDFFALIKLINLFRSFKPNMTISISPKAGLLASIAGKLVNIKHRIHWFTGQVWATKYGIKKYLLKFFDKLIYNLSTYCLIDSKTQQQFLIKNKIIQYDKSYVLGSGSVGGVNILRFCRKNDLRNITRNKYGIDSEDFIFLYLGRLKYEKGIVELIKAFNQIKNEYVKVRLLLVGAIEDKGLRKYVDTNEPRISFFDPTDKPELFFNISDVLCLPSHREGFGTVIIEAAANGLPSIGSNIYGIQDAILNNVTGLLHEVKSTEDLKKKMIILLDDRKLLNQLGDQACLRASKEFDSKIITNLFVNFCEKMK